MWGYTPKRIAAFLFIADKRQISDMAVDMSNMAMASRGDPKAFKRQMSRLRKDADK